MCPFHSTKQSMRSAFHPVALFIEVVHLFPLVQNTSHLLNLTLIAGFMGGCCVDWAIWSRVHVIYDEKPLSHPTNHIVWSFSFPPVPFGPCLLWTSSMPYRIMPSVASASLQPTSTATSGSSGCTRPMWLMCRLSRVKSQSTQCKYFSLLSLSILLAKGCMYPLQCWWKNILICMYYM